MSKETVYEFVLRISRDESASTDLRDAATFALQMKALYDQARSEIAELKKENERLRANQK